MPRRTNKLTAGTVRRLRRYYQYRKQRHWNENRSGGHATSIYELADRFNVAYSTMHSALTGGTWRNV